ncbi:hypothetical protein [Pseudomonas sp. O11]|uniref:hypothetical protein n=1 Tax=Pseudomonas sp. O11 TaxID=3159446 RepID=UPI00387B1C3D
MALIPVAAALTGLFVWGEVEAGKKNTAENKAKEWKSFEPRLDHAFNKYKRHFAKGEFAQAINALKEYIDLNRLRGSVAPEDEKMLGRMLDNLTFKAQAKGLALSREFKAKEEDLKDEPFERSNAHYEYIEKLKAVLPKEDTFLRKEVEHYERLNPKVSLYD